MFFNEEEIKFDMQFTVLMYANEVLFFFYLMINVINFGGQFKIGKIENMTCFRLNFTQIVRLFLGAVSINE